MEFGKVFKKIREESGLKQKEFAAQLGLTPSALWKIESGKVFPKRETIESLCRQSGLPRAWVYTMAFTLEDYCVSDEWRITKIRVPDDPGTLFGPEE